MASNRSVQKSPFATKTVAIAVAAGLVIAASVGWLLYINSEPGAPAVPPPSPAQVALGAAFAELDTMTRELQNATILPSEDGQSVIVRGRVPSQATVEKIKAALAKVQPSVPLVVEARIGS